MPDYCPAARAGFPSMKEATGIGHVIIIVIIGAWRFTEPFLEAGKAEYMTAGREAVGDSTYIKAIKNEIVNRWTHAKGLSRSSMQI